MDSKLFSSSANTDRIAMAHGVGAVKEMYIDFFARRFAEAGMAALLFDYRFFGASAAVDWFARHLIQS